VTTNSIPLSVILTPFTVDTLKPKCFQMAERKLGGGPSSSIPSLDMGAGRLRTSGNYKYLIN